MWCLGLILLSILGCISGLDLSGCRPREPKLINALMQFEGDIFSPGYAEGVKYPNDVHCAHTIVAPYGFRIRLSFLDMDLEAFDGCGRDSLMIHEGVNSQGPLHGIFCGNSTYPDLMSLGNAFHIVFHSDFMMRRKGFHLRYSIASLKGICPLGESACRNRKCFNYRQKCDGKDDCGDGTDEEQCGFPLPTTACGLRPGTSYLNEGYDRVIGGRVATPGSWPWQADLQLAFFFPNGHSCGGTLINAQWVLTAAHCFAQNKLPQEWRIHFGNHHKFYKDATEQVRYAERIIIYPNITGEEVLQWQLETLTHDIALIKLNAPVMLGPAVRPACLPKQGYELKVGTQCSATGWGNTRGTGSDEVLKEIDFHINPGKNCDSSQVGPFNNATTICVRNLEGLQDVCHGDSGGPLVCQYDGTWQVMGATSYGSQGNLIGGLCAMPGSGTIYTKVSAKVDWINQMINKYS